jgi:hypothetical protein
MHYACLGARSGGRIDSAHEETAIDARRALFPSFSVSRAMGVFKGKTEETLIFYIATADAAKITDLAIRLRERIDQDGVGVIRPTSQSGFYSRVI